jgi:hypothetical protein
MKNSLSKSLVFGSAALLLVLQNAALAGPPPGKGKPVPEPEPTDPRPCETGDPRTRIDCFGVSGGTRKFLEKPDGKYYYYAGTIGALVSDAGGNRYMLSNNHVFAQENGNGGTVSSGERIIQPGNLEWYYDASLEAASVDAGHLTEWLPIIYGPQRPEGDNVVDAAIAQLTDNTYLDPQGRILGIGPIAGGSVSPADMLGQPVHKAGRTTGHTWGRVAAVSVDNVAVTYDGGTAYFDDQVYIENQADCGAFSDGGDSGSLIVSGPDETSGLSSPVALLFAGGDQGTFGNPIGTVLESFNVGSLEFVTCQGSESECATYVTSVGSCLGGGGRNGNRGKKKSAERMSAIALKNIQEVKARHRDNIAALAGVTGIGVAADHAGQPELVVFVESKANARGIPAHIEGYSVQLIETGTVKAY